MCVKLANRSCSVFFIALAMNIAAAAPPSGVREALAEFETGATRAGRCAADAKIGTRKEISRFQILPSVWQEYSTSRDYRDPNTAWAVTKKILSDREKDFQRATGREWDYVDLYLMWNAPGLYERAKWNRNRISRVVLERAKRFSNLMQKRSAVYLAQR